MLKKLKDKKWKAHNYKYRQLFLKGLSINDIKLYDNRLIEKLRTIYDNGLPASIILLSNTLSNGYCYDRALLMSQAFLDTDYDINLIYAEVDSLKLNPNYEKTKDKLENEHCIVEVITKDKHYIIDTSFGFIYDKKLYWLLENPKIRKIETKKELKEKIKNQNNSDYNLELSKYRLPFIIPSLEKLCKENIEIYSLKGVELLQKEINHFKKVIDYDSICEEINQDMKKLSLKK